MEIRGLARYSVGAPAAAPQPARQIQEPSSAASFEQAEINSRLRAETANELAARPVTYSKPRPPAAASEGRSDQPSYGEGGSSLVNRTLSLFA